MLQLVRLTQQHRVPSADPLAGHAEAGTRRQAVQTEAIDTQFALIDTAFSRLGQRLEQRVASWP